MAKVSSKRQVTLPVALCNLLDIEPGDEVESYVAGGKLTLVKQVKGAAKGLLKGRKTNKTVSDEESLQSALA